MIVIASKYLIPKGYTAITLFPFIFIKDESMKNNILLINHERIHLRQQAELLIIPFYIWYVIEYFILLLVYHNKTQAYRNISFEREAYNNEHNLNYLKNRTFWKFLKFLA
ncbi:hypothetical protein [Flavobacterium sp. NRK1]|uniref:hypothetical protein n=1 Tax=Flavobacterium sp. NRK1 TaxID=2954929 RepID=UPI002093A321|nr:hypothetical protein [Flavobacterium sp. NRK1]MCO6148256.1 hypothetical protein [Flavobacterium sp. NRK1]